MILTLWYMMVVCLTHSTRWNPLCDIVCRADCLAKCLPRQIQPYFSFLFNRKYQIKMWDTDIILEKSWTDSQKGTESLKNTLVHFNYCDGILLATHLSNDCNIPVCVCVWHVVRYGSSCFPYFCLKYMQCSSRV